MIPFLIDISCSTAAANGKTGAQLDEELRLVNAGLWVPPDGVPETPLRHWSDKYKHPKERISQRQFRRWATQGNQCRTQY